MSTQYPGGFISKSPPLPNGSTARGIWTLNQQAAYRKANLWPYVPGAPTNATATVASATSASVSFTAPADTGSSAITGYTVTSSPGNLTGTGASSPITVSGLTTNTAYTFTVTATNGAGTGPASSASNSVTPVAQDNFQKIYGTATSFTIQTSLPWTVSNSVYSTYSSAYNQNGQAFWSYMSTTTQTTTANGTSNWYGDSSVPVGQQTSTLSSVTVDGNSGSYNGYNIPQSIVWSTTDDGIWMSSNTNTATISVNISSANFNAAKYFLYRGYGSTYSFHNPYVIKITANGISRLFAIQNLSGRSSPGSVRYVAYFAPLNSSFTSFTDSRLTNGGSTLDSSYFEWI